MLRLLAAVAAASVLVGVWQAGAHATRAETGVVARVVDGDTLTLRDGRRVRLVQIDTPELGSGECYSRASARTLRRLAPAGARVTLAADARLDATDAYGRLLRYAFVGGRNVNLELVRRGAATVWFYRGERGRYAAQLLRAGLDARARRRGLWGACRAVWDPYAPATTGAGNTSTAKCDPSYPDVCIPPPPPDLDCGDVRHSRFRVVGSDPHRFDGDHDGLGCEGRG